MIYFDNSATTRIKPECVYEAYDYYVRNIGVSPGRGSYSIAIEASRLLYKSRKCVADYFKIENTNNIIFTKNSTEAINLFFNGYLKSGDHVLISEYEHNAVLRPLHYLSLTRGIEYSIICDEDLYSLDINNIKKYVKKNTKLAAITLASNLTGQLVYSSPLGKILHDFGLKVMVDVSQGAGKLEINMKEDSIDYIAFTGHKDLYGLPGSGGLCSLDELKITPLIQGGTGIFGDLYINPESYPDAYEAGTLNMPAIWALKAGIEYVNANQDKINSIENNLMSYLMEGLSENKKIKIYNSFYKRVSTCCFNIEGHSSSEVVNYLDNNDICCRGGIHCAILAHKNIGTEKIGAVRVSLNYLNTKDEVNKLIRVLGEC